MWLLMSLACTPDSNPVDPTTPVTTPEPAPPTPPEPTTPEPTTPEPDPGPPLLDIEPTNLVFVSVDTTRRDRIGRYRAEATVTPNLDAFLDQAVVLDEHRSCSNWTAPSMTCATTGALPMEQGWWPWYFGFDPIPGSMVDLPTLAVQLRDLGFDTTVVTANTVFGQQVGMNLGNGFDTRVETHDLPGDVVTDLALAEIDALLATPDPFYLHVHYFDPHANYCPPEGYVGPDYQGMPAVDLCTDFYGLVETELPTWDQARIDRFVLDVLELYEAEVRFFDAQFGRLIDELDARGALDDTLVVFVTDHGEQFLERGDVGHGKVLGSEENRAAAAFWAKDLAPAAWDGPTVHQDLAVSVQHLFGITPVGPVSGIVVGDAAPDRTIRAMNNWSQPQLTVIQGEHQLRYQWWGDAQLHLLDQDPEGLVDAYAPDAPEALALWPAMDAFVADVQAEWPFLAPPIPADR